MSFISCPWPRDRLLLRQLLLHVENDHAPEVLIGYFLKRFEQTQHLQIFDTARHGKGLIENWQIQIGKTMQWF